MKEYVSWKVFALAVTIIIVAFGFAFTLINNVGAKVEEYNEGITGIKVQLSQIQVDLVWIKEKIK